MENEELICTVCEEEYDTDSKTPRILPDCGHTFCTECLDQLIDKAKNEGEKFTCPEDRIPCSTLKPANEFPKNFCLLRMAQKKSTSKPSEKKVEKNMCPVHHRKLEVIWVDDQVRICTNCALFGDHKNHDIRQEDDVLKEITLRTELLIDIYELIEQNKNNLGDQKEIDDLYNQFMTKQIALKRHVANKFKEYYNDLLRKEKDVVNAIEKNFDSIEKKFEEIKNGPKKVMQAAEEWCKTAQDKMEKFNNPTSTGDKSNIHEYIAFEMLEDHNNDDDVIRVGEKVLEDLDKNTQPPVPQLQQRLSNLTVQFDEHFKNKLEMLCHVPVVEGADVITETRGKPTEKNTSLNSFKSTNNEPSKQIEKLPINKVKSTDKNLLDDDNDNDLLGSFSLNDKLGKDDNLMGHTEEINFLNDIPDPTGEDEDPSIVGNTDAAYDVISEVLENGGNSLNLSGRKLGDEFFASMIESIIDFAEGDPLSITSLNLSNNEITDVGCEKICEFLIIEKDNSVANLVELNLSCNKIKDKSVDIIMALFEENTKLEHINLAKNQFRSKLVINKLKSVKDKELLL